MKQTEDTGFWHTMTSLGGDIIKNSMLSVIKNVEYHILKTIDDVKKSIFASLMTGFMLILGIVYITLGLIFFVSTYADIPNAWGFLVIGLIVMIVGLLRIRTEG